MKMITILAAAFIVLASACKKEEAVTPVQRVKYEVECTSCLVYVDDNFRTEKPFVVNGLFKYTFENETRDSVKLRVFVSAFSPEQEVRAYILRNDGKGVGFKEKMGNPADFSKNYPFDKEIVLSLR